MHAIIHRRPLGHKHRGRPILPTTPREGGILVRVAGVEGDGWKQAQGFGRDVLEGRAGLEGGKGDGLGGGGVGAEVGEDGGAEGGVG